MEFMVVSWSDIALGCAVMGGAAALTLLRRESKKADVEGASDSVKPVVQPPATLMSTWEALREEVVTHPGHRSTAHKEPASRRSESPAAPVSAVVDAPSSCGGGDSGGCV